MHGDFIHAIVRHGTCVGVEYVVHLANYQVVVLLGESGSFDEEPHDRSRHFGIGKDADDGSSFSGTR